MLCLKSASQGRPNSSSQNLQYLYWPSQVENIMVFCDFCFTLKYFLKEVVYKKKKSTSHAPIPYVLLFSSQLTYTLGGFVLVKHATWLKLKRSALNKGNLKSCLTYMHHSGFIIRKFCEEHRLSGCFH
jgi:hypothetical protein